jgi:hypothetical protein
VNSRFAAVVVVPLAQRVMMMMMMASALVPVPLYETAACAKMERGMMMMKKGRVQ